MPLTPSAAALALRPRKHSTPDPSTWARSRAGSPVARVRARTKSRLSATAQMQTPAPAHLEMLSVLAPRLHPVGIAAGRFPSIAQLPIPLHPRQTRALYSPPATAGRL